MFNVTGGELVIVLIIALVVLGPERLPGAARSVGKVMAQIRDLSNGFQKEFKSALDEVTDPLESRLKPHMPMHPRPAMPDRTNKAHSAEMASASPQSDLGPGMGHLTPPRPVLPETPAARAGVAPPERPAVPTGRDDESAPSSGGPAEV